MYTFCIPKNFSDNYVKLTGGREYHEKINLSQAQYETMTGCSIQAVASSPVKVEAWMSNIPSFPFNELTDRMNWTTPAPSAIGDLWVPCTSIDPFTVMPGANFFQRYDFTDVCSFLLLTYSTLGIPVNTEVAFSLRICFK